MPTWFLVWLLRLPEPAQISRLTQVWPYAVSWNRCSHLIQFLLRELTNWSRKSQSLWINHNWKNKVNVNLRPPLSFPSSRIFHFRRSVFPYWLPAHGPSIIWNCHHGQKERWYHAHFSFPEHDVVLDSATVGAKILERQLCILRKIWFADV